MSLEDILHYFGSYLVEKEFVSQAARWIVWMLAKGLVWLTDALETMSNAIFESGLKNPYFQSAGFVNLIHTLKPVLYGMTILAILYLGFFIMFTPKFDKRKLFVNVVLSMFIVTSLSTVIAHANTLSSDAYKTIKTTNASTGEEIVRQNTTDVLSLDKTNWKKVPTASLKREEATLTQYPVMTQEERIAVPEASIMSIGYPTEIIDPDETKFRSDISKDVFANILVFDTEEVKMTTESLEKHAFIRDLNIKKFRWKIDMPSVFIELGAICFVLAFLSISMFKVFFDQGIMYMLTLFTSAYDFANGQKMKRSFYELLNMFAWIFIYALFMKMYLNYANWVTHELEITTIAKWIGLIAGAFACYKGNNKVEQILGLSTGHGDAAANVLMLTQLNKSMQALNQQMVKLGKTFSNGTDKRKTPSIIKNRNTNGDNKSKKQGKDLDSNPNLGGLKTNKANPKEEKNLSNNMENTDTSKLNKASKENVSGKEKSSNASNSNPNITSPKGDRKNSDNANFDSLSGMEPPSDNGSFSQQSNPNIDGTPNNNKHQKDSKSGSESLAPKGYNPKQARNRSSNANLTNSKSKSSDSNRS
ncbi:pLS20_p028 family conjugation system transmembrane protein [Listeria innocua]|uniref:pLS20_p028 family conjugation system transmembrane protein n=1 Tax=Listeria innocua TaxID=1642 RepID=UPI0016298BF6|nr:hypothetical protein [Listeria innocua]MBC2139689.1 hypothetical protein [Listeria innocua]